MTDVFGELKDLYWASRGALLFAAGAAAVGTHLLLLVWTFRNLGELSHLRERLSRLADGLALLTDTTEAGLSALSEDVKSVRRADRGVVRRDQNTRRADRGVIRHPDAANPDNAIPAVAATSTPAPAVSPAAEPETPPKRAASSRSGAARRIALAARKGERIGAIAEREALSESEVRLHIALADGTSAGRAKQKRAS